MAERPAPPRRADFGAFERDSEDGRPTRTDGRGEAPTALTPQGEDLCAVVGRNFRDARRRAGLTQVQVADRIGSAGSYVGSVERGDANLTLGTLARLASAVGVDARALILGRPPGRTAADPSKDLIDALQASIQSLRAVQASSGAGLDAMEAVLGAMRESTGRAVRPPEPAERFGDASEAF